MTTYLKCEHMLMIGNKDILVYPNYLNSDARARSSQFGYKYDIKGDVLDPLTSTKMSSVAFMHTHPNNSPPSFFNGDTQFAAEIHPNKPMYVQLINVEDKMPFENVKLYFTIGNGKSNNSTELAKVSHSSNIDRYLSESGLSAKTLLT